jgi:tetratricopeptide (TPR) repeat protein
LFIEELTKAVLESGILTDTGDRYVVTGPVAPLAIPTTLHASLLARLDRLAPTREVAQIAAALGRQFSHELISAVAMRPKQQLDEALAQLVHAELIFRRGTPPDAEYTFKHALVQDAAYSTLLRSRRLQLHAHIAATLEEQFPKIVLAQPALLAQHCTEAALAEKAVSYWLKAAQQAWARSAMMETVTQLQKGLQVLMDLPDGPGRQQQELDLQIALGPALTATKGYSAPDVGETVARARALAEQLERPDYLVPLLYGQWVFHLIRAEHRRGRPFAQQMEKIGQARNDVAASLLSRLLKGITLFTLGDFTTARARFEQAHGLGDRSHRTVCRAFMAEDPHAVNLVHLAMTLIYLGYIDLGRARLNEALLEARGLDHAYTLAWVLNFMCEAAWAVSLPRESYRYTEELLTLSNEHGFPFWSALGSLHRGWSMARLGNAKEGLTVLTKGLSDRRATGAQISTPQALMLLGEAYAMNGQPVEGLNWLAEATRFIETTQEGRDEAELCRLRGDLLNATGDRAAAEQGYHEALMVAKRQRAKLSELRAATSLAHLWCDQGKRTAARDLLAAVYGWFTEGFDTPVLKEAKAVLEQLAA